MTSSAHFLWRQQKTSRRWLTRRKLPAHWLREIAFTASRSIRVWSNRRRRWWLFYQSNADDDEEEVSLKDFECKTRKKLLRRAMFVKEKVFGFYSTRDLFYFFSGWKFSSSSLLKILLGFRLKLLFFLCNGNCLSTECLGCFCVAFRVGKWQYFRLSGLPCVELWRLLTATELRND